MTQPFRLESDYQSTLWPDLSITHKEDHLLIHSPSPLLTFSSALWGGGISWSRNLVNWKVPLSYRCENPVDMMRDQIEGWGYPSAETIGLQTAAKLTHASIQEEAGDKFKLLCCSTAGTGNAARAGRVRQTYSAYQCGTINIFVIVDGKLSSSAIINAIMTATEAKTAALQDLQITDHRGELATGTTSDAIVLAVSQSDSYGVTHPFAGTATSIGNAVGRLVYQSVCEAVATQGEK